MIITVLRSSHNLVSVCLVIVLITILTISFALMRRDAV